jgi:hypothetical protein
VSRAFDPGWKALDDAGLEVAWPGWKADDELEEYELGQRVLDAYTNEGMAMLYTHGIDRERSVQRLLISRWLGVAV